MTNAAPELKILSIDIGGSHVKATILNNRGEPQSGYSRVETPRPSNPENIIRTIQDLVKPFEYSYISVGFPGYVKNGVIYTAPNLGTDVWSGVDLSKKLQEVLGRPVKVVNDADMQGLGVVSGKGFEMVLTLGTGFGTALLQDGFLLPHIELAHHPVTKNKTYDQYIGEQAFQEVGVKKWNKRMKRVFSILKTVFNYDFMYIGGGNADEITFKLDSNMKVITNKDGIKGGARLWLTKETDPMVNAVSSPSDKINEEQ